MKKIILKLNNFNKADIDTIVGELNKGKIIAYPTDTVYGLGCDATNKPAIDKIYKIKKRPKNKPLLILVNGLEMADKYLSINKDQLFFLSQIWPGPYTAILSAKKKLPTNLQSAEKSVGARFPKNKFLVELITKLGRPIVSTSLNLTDRSNIHNVDNLDVYFPEKSLPDILINAGNLKSKKPSTMVDIRNIYKIKILRK
jgi:L-threonylcarbamoyladenylate synthase